MMHLLERAGYRTLELGKHSRALENINSTVDYRTLETGPRPFVFAVSGWKNSGKTTMITRLVPELVRRGYKVAVIKHDGHDFESDVPGTDSYRQSEGRGLRYGSIFRSQVSDHEGIPGDYRTGAVCCISGSRYYSDRRPEEQSVSEIFLPISGAAIDFGRKTGR